MHFVLHGCLNLRIIFLLVSNVTRSKSLGGGTHSVSTFCNILHKFHDKMFSTSLILTKKKKKRRELFVTQCYWMWIFEPFLNVWIGWDAESFGCFQRTTSSVGMDITPNHFFPSLKSVIRSRCRQPQLCMDGGFCVIMHIIGFTQMLLQYIPFSDSWMLPLIAIKWGGKNFKLYFLADLFYLIKTVETYSDL